VPVIRKKYATGRIYPHPTPMILGTLDSYVKPGEPVLDRAKAESSPPVGPPVLWAPGFGAGFGIDLGILLIFLYGGAGAKRN